MKLSRKEKKNKDRFSITLVGAIAYSIILIMVMAGSYIAVKTVFRNQERKSAITTIEEEVKEPVEEIVDEPEVEETEETMPETEEAEEESLEVSNYEHKAELSDILDEETGLVDYDKTVFEPEKRDRRLRWEDTVFSRIEDVSSPKEALVNRFDIKRVSTELKDNKEVSYISYINPESGSTEKITEKVNCGENTQIIDYYYDQGSINYVAQYDMIIDKPVSLASAEIESRYYFCNDVLVRYIYCGDGKAIEYTVADIGNYSKGTVEQFDYLEDSMLNRAYIVYNLARELEEFECVDGYVLDEFSVPLDEIVVSIVRDSDGKEVAHSTTDGDGYYKLTLKPEEDTTYTLKVDHEGFIGVNVYGITAKSGAKRFSVDPIYLAYNSNGAYYNVQILVRDAVDSGKTLSGGKIKLRRGINDTEGEVIASGQLDDNGAALVPMSAGCYTAEVSKGGYETTYFSVIVKSDHQVAIGFAVPDVAVGDYTAVLTWESTPLDLDFLAISSGGYDVYKSAGDSLGATMAEVISIKNASDGVYRFYVKDLGSISTGDALSYNMTNSNACVTLYDSNGQVGSFHVPIASAGIVWEAVEIANGRVLPANNYYYTIEDSPIWTSK